MFTQDIKIPKERVAVFIGTKGATKRSLQKATKTILRISKEGDVNISGEDSLNVFITVNIVRAIGRGFNPKIAEKLLDERMNLEIIDVGSFSRKTTKDMKRIRARIIGTEGKARSMLESLTKTKISVYGKTVSIIGAVEDVMIAKSAIEKLLQGSPHGNVYGFIDRQKEKTFEEES